MSKPPRKYIAHPPPPPPSLSSLPDEIILRCLALVPRSYHLSLSWVSKSLRALVRSPELNSLRSTRHKSSLHVCFQEDFSSFHWFTLRPNDETTTTEHGLVLNPTPFPPHPNYGSSTVAVGSKIFFIGGSTELSSDLWILDTRSGNMTQGPSMSVPRKEYDAAVGVVDGKIYVIGGDVPFSDRIFHEVEEEEVQVEVFDPTSDTWELAGPENVLKTFFFTFRCSASALVEPKVYMVEYEYTSVYNTRESEGERLVQMVSQRLEKDGRKDRLKDTVRCVCVVEDVLFAFFERSGIMWFNTKLNVWRKLVGRDGKRLAYFLLKGAVMAEQDGKLVVLYFDFVLPEGLWAENEVADTVTNSVQCMTMLVSLDRAGDRICGTIDWSGIVATLPYSFRFLHCLAVSD